MYARPAKLRDGSWGAKTTAPVEVGDIVTVRAATNNKSWEAKMVEVVWTDGTVWLCKTQSLASPQSSARRPKSAPGVAGKSSRKCRASGCGQLATKQGYCAQCFFDEYDF